MFSNVENSLDYYIYFQGFPRREGGETYRAVDITKGKLGDFLHG